MNDFKNLMVNNINDNSIWKILEDNFNRFYIEGQKEVNIPKKIHQIWLGGDLPDKYKRIKDTWIEKNPDWQYRLWTDKDIDSFDLSHINNLNVGSRSDILRYYILYEHGGLYVDTDFECLKSFNDLLYLDFFSGTGHVYEPETFNGLIASKPKYNLIKLLMDNVKVENNRDFDKIIAATGPKYLSRILFEYIKNNTNDKIVVFPTKFFYAFPAEHRFLIRDDNFKSREMVSKFCTEKSYCVHLWYTSWQK